MSFGKGHHLHLIDGYAFIFRAYHALPPLTRKSDGLPIGAVSGFCYMLQRYLDGGGDYQLVLAGGDDYELCFTTSKENSTRCATDG